MRSVSLFVVLLATVTACHTNKTSDASPVVASSTPPVIITPAPTLSTPSPVVDAGPRAAATAEYKDGPIDAPIFPVPATPAGASADEVLIASSICAAGYVIDPVSPRPSIGCRSHPPFVKPEQMPDGKLPKFTGADRQDFCSINQILHGSFTRAGAKQAVVVFDGCVDAHGDTWDMAMPGSAVLVEKIDGHFKEIAYEGNVHAEHCKQPHRKDGRDFLMCQSGLGTGSSGDVSYFFLLDFARPSPHSGTVAILFSDGSVCNLTNPDAFHLDKGLVNIAIRNVTVANDVNGDGTPDLQFDVDRRYIPPSPAFDAKAKPLCKANKSLDSLLPEAKRTHIQIVSSGDSFFAPTPDSQKELDAWDAATDSMYGLKGAAPPMLTR